MMSFTCFQQLPPELRLYIWELALPGPRVIEINGHLNHLASAFVRASLSSETEDETAQFDLSLLEIDYSAFTTSNDVLNTLYQTCKESHDVIKQHYGRHFRGILVDDLPWMNSSVDILYFRERGNMKSFLITRGSGDNEQELQQLSAFKHLAMPIPVHLFRASEQLHTMQDPPLMYHALRYCHPKSITFVYDWTERINQHDFHHFVQQLKCDYQERGPEILKEIFEPTLLDKIEIKVVHQTELGRL